MQTKWALLVLLDTLHLLAFSAWFGGLILLLLLPSKEAHNPPVIPQQTPFFLCGLVVFGSEWVLRRRYRADRSKNLADSLRQTLVLAALLLEEFWRQERSPSTLAASQGLEIAQLTVLVAVAVITVWLQTPRLTAEPASSQETNRK